MQHLTEDETLKLLKCLLDWNNLYFVATLVGVRHGLRVSEIVGQRTRLQGTYADREKAEARRREFRGATIRETTRKTRTGRVRVFQVLTLQPTLVGGLKPESFRDGFLTVKRLKGSNKTTQPLLGHDNPLLDERVAVVELLRTAPAGKLLFPVTRKRFWEIIKEQGRKAGIPYHRAFPHVLKHSVAMQNIDKVGVHNLRSYLGHKSGASTMEYLKVSDQEASAAMAAAMGAH